MTSKKRFISLAMASAIASMGVLGAAGAAMAVDGAPGPIPADKNGSSTITLTKYKQGSTTVANETGTEAAKPADGTTLDGVNFELKPVTKIGDTDISQLDYTKDASWAVLNGLFNDLGQPNGDVTVGATIGDAKTTDTNGVITWDNLNFGVYQVVETGVADDKAEAYQGLTPAVPSYVILPFYNSIDGVQSWNTDVHIYPKNTIDSVLKEVKDKSTGFGKELNYTLTTSTTAPGSKATDEYIIEDIFPGGVVLGDDDPVLSIMNGEEKVDDLVAVTDYTLTKTAIKGDPGFTVTMTESGRQKIADAFIANPAAVVKTNFTAVVNEWQDGEDIFKNTVNFQPNGNAMWDTKPLTDDVESKFGAIEIKKVAQENQDLALGGATFELYGSEADAKARTNKLVSQGGVSEWTTGDDGTVTIDNLQYSTFWNGAEQTEAPIEYWLVETKAPEGRQINVEPTKVEVGGVTETTITNVKKDVGLSLPPTGAALTIVLGVTAAGLGAGAILSRRRENQD